MPSRALAVLAASLIANAAAAQVPDGGAPPPPPVAHSKFTPTPVVSSPTGSPAAKLAWLKTQIEAALADPQLASAKVGIEVADVATQTVLYRRAESALYNPASNAKLFTAAAALAVLGPEYRWKTVVYTDGVSGGVARDLYLKGYGDPTLMDEDLWQLVSRLWEMGVRRVSGNLIVDDSFFDDVRVGPGFDQKPEDLPFRAPEGALSLDYNVVGVRVLPGASDGAPARIVIDPQTPYFTVINETRTVASGRTLLTLDTSEVPDHTVVTVRGRIRLHHPGQDLARRVAHPGLYTAWAFRALLERRGIKVGGAVMRGTVPPGARGLVAHYSQPMGVVVRHMNKHSNNFMAEMVLKTLGAETGGAPGTWQKGLDAVAGFLDQIGIPHASYKMINGSGLYDSDRFTPSQIVRLLEIVYKDFRFAADFVGSLALAGADGTVGHRMEGSLAERWVRAKTGTLEGVSCLSGYAGAPGRAPLAFAILMNGLKTDATFAARRAEDKIAEALVAFQLAR